jgi:hypothetical protein
MRCPGSSPYKAAQMQLNAFFVILSKLCEPVGVFIQYARQLLVDNTRIDIHSDSFANIGRG